jgi:hypothetical protein
MSMDVLCAYVLELDAAIATSSVSPEFRGAWAGFCEEVAFSLQNTADQRAWPLVEHYRRRLNDWLTMFTAEAYALPRNADAASPAAPSAEQRYRDATSYVRRALQAIEPPAWQFWERPAFDAKTAEPRSELEHLEARWSGATTVDERAKLAREAELLADRVQESLPGAPQDRARTNLFKGEVQRSTPATSYLGELLNERSDGGGRNTDWGRIALIALAGAGALALVGGVLRR